MDYFPDNTLTHFMTRLPQIMDLDRSWEIGLAGTRYQRGHGLGSIFGGLFKAAVPLLKKGAKTLGRKALKTGLNIDEDVVAGKNLKQAAKSRLKSTGKTYSRKPLLEWDLPVSDL